MYIKYLSVSYWQTSERYNCCETILHVSKYEHGDCEKESEVIYDMLEESVVCL